MRWVILALIGVSTCFAQPVNGPFVILASDSSSYVSQMRIASGDNNRVVLFYQRSRDGERMIQTRDLLIATDTLAADSQVVYLRQSGLSTIELVTAKPNGDWFMVQGRTSQYVMMWETQGDTGSFVAPWHCIDPLNPFAYFDDFRVLPLESDRWSVSFLNWYIAGPFQESGLCGIRYIFDAEGPSDSCTWWDFDTYWTVVAPELYSVPANDHTDYALVSSFDSWSDEPNFLIATTDSCPSVESSAEQHIDGCAMDIRRNNSGIMLALQRSCPVVGGDLRYWVTAFDTSGALWEGEQHPVPTDYEKIVWHPSFGWAALFYKSHYIKLVRIAANGELAEPLGTVYWWDGAYQIDKVEAVITDEGLIHIVWREFIPGSALLHRYQYASLHWNTTLDAQEPPTPIAQDFALSAYPNPFNSFVRIEYDLPRAGDVRLSVFNTLGQEVATLVDERVSAGAHSLTWSPDGASGVYLVRLVSNDFVSSKKVLYIR